MNAQIQITNPAVSPTCRVNPPAAESNRPLLMRLTGDLPLHCGVRLEGLEIGYQLNGNANGPLCVLLGGISAHSNAISCIADDDPGWWDSVMGPTALDIASHWQVLSLDWLGGNGATTGPGNWGGTPEDFPPVDVRDQAGLLSRLLLELDIPQIDSLISASYGGMVAMRFAADYPQQVRRVLVAGASHRPDPMARARRLLQRQVIGLAETPDQLNRALATARALAITTYRSPAEFASRFAGQVGAASLASYLRYHGKRFADSFCPIAFLRLSESIDQHALDPKTIAAPVEFVSFKGDQVCPPGLIRELFEQTPTASKLHELETLYGHDAFLADSAVMQPVVSEFLAKEGGS